MRHGIAYIYHYMITTYNDIGDPFRDPALRYSASGTRFRSAGGTIAPFTRGGSRCA